MRLLTANDAIRLWQDGPPQAFQAALSLLTAALPERPRDELRSLTLGETSQLLWELRQRTLGSNVSAVFECVNCKERLEFGLNAGDVLLTGSPSHTDVLELNSGDYTVRFRLLSLGDLEVSPGTSVEALRRKLIERCVVEARRSEQAVSALELPESVITDLGERLTELDPGAELVIQLSCPACASIYALPFNIASFLYVEIGAQARRLLSEVRALARAYGWREQEILSLHPRRRQFYLNMLDQ